MHAAFFSGGAAKPLSDEMRAAVGTNAEAMTRHFTLAMRTALLPPPLRTPEGAAAAEKPKKRSKPAAVEKPTKRSKA